MRLEQADEALETYWGEQGPDELASMAADLITDLLILVRESGDKPERVLSVVEMNLAAEPESVEDFYALASYHERLGHTSIAVKLYEKYDDMGGES